MNFVHDFYRITPREVLLSGYNLIICTEPPAGLNIGETNMQFENVMKDFEDLPEIAKKEVADFIAFLKMRYFSQESERPIKQINLRDDPFVGLWKNRSDLQDSTKIFRLRCGSFWKV